MIYSKLLTASVVAAFITSCFADQTQQLAARLPIPVLPGQRAAIRGHQLRGRLCRPL